MVTLFAAGQFVDGMESVPGAVTTGSPSRDSMHVQNDPVATAPGTDLLTRTRNNRRNRIETIG